MTFGNYIKQLRQSQNISLRELARLSNIAYSTISRIENDIVKPNIDTMSKLANALNVSSVCMIQRLIEFKIFEEENDK